MGRRAAIGLALLFLWGCADRDSDNRSVNVTRAELLAQLQLGRSVLRCREACLPGWRDAQPHAAQLDGGRQWGDLAVLVMRTGYQDDLSLYYLGRAAEGMGFYPAAASYYRQSMELSGTSISCTNLSRLCGGLALPAAAARRLDVVQERLTKPVIHHRQTVVRPPTTTATTNQAREPAALIPDQTVSPTATDTGIQNQTTVSPAASTPAAIKTPDSVYVEPPPSADYVEAPPSAGYVEPPGDTVR
jgi:hypothetical protein